MPVIPVSWGEIIDKLTILEIKMDLINDTDKHVAVRRQYEQILDYLADEKESRIERQDPDYEKLYQINRHLWDCENLIRLLTRQSNFGEDYVQVSKDIRSWNDDRARVKKKIDQRLKSSFWDVKNHPGI